MSNSLIRAKRKLLVLPRSITMAGRKTSSDVAKRAGVSVATVDRVLNGRQRVRKETMELVYLAAQDVGYDGVGL